MSQEFTDWAGWYTILDYLYDELFGRAFLELLDNWECDLTTRGRRGLFSARNVQALIDSLNRLDKDSDSDQVGKWLRQQETHDVFVVKAAIEKQLQQVEYSEDNMPECPKTAWEAVFYCLSSLCRPR